MPSDLAALVRFIERAPRCEPLEALNEEFALLVERFGVRWFNYVHVADLMSPPAPRTLFGRPDSFWSDHYNAKRYFEVDPCVPRALAGGGDFTWTEARRGAEDPRVARMFDEAREAGPAEGLIIPIREATGAVTAMRLMTVAPDFTPTTRSILHIATHAYVGRGRRLMSADAPPRDCPLSPREIECLTWASQGKTAWETGRILDLSAATVQKHMDNAKLKLGVNSRMLAVLEALKHGWLAG
ncbi:autoinducer binding domain-containing protein [Caulobacter sp. CCUG 60055]|uniref:helix-turn-helix transcriptional regulator n=1 Tax=Caulobacter sp. CCUG 60055 TaxID=2100090 RepID=UPI001FA7582C|nr:LuxR family transcriptional regulator [Caulobacteraceae bacterium]